MRVIAGSARSIPLVSPAGMNTRPTTDKIKETLFNILQPDIGGAAFMDLFAGSGAIGIEALSRGAKSAVFMDNSRAAIEAVKANVRKCRFEDRSRIMLADARKAASFIPKDRDGGLIIFMDPPYNKDLEIPVLSELIKGGAAEGDTLFIVEEALEYDTGKFAALGLIATKVKEYKKQKHIFLRMEF